MSASERLAALKDRIDYEPHPEDFVDAVVAALPEIVAVLRAMERLLEDGTAPITDEIVYVIRASTRDEVRTAVAALEDALTAGGSE